MALNNIGRGINRFADSEAGKLVATIAISYFTAGYGMGWPWRGGFASGCVMTGSLEGAAMGAIFAGASFGVGTLAGKMGEGIVREAARATMHGVLGGIRSKMAGGSFSSGFKAAGLATVVSHAGGFAKAGVTSKGGQIAAAAVLGGTVSEMSGGKFANGAVSAAFAEGYNNQSSKIKAKLMEIMEDGTLEFKPKIMGAGITINSDGTYTGEYGLLSGAGSLANGLKELDLGTDEISITFSEFEADSFKYSVHSPKTIEPLGYKIDVGKYLGSYEGTISTNPYQYLKGSRIDIYANRARQVDRQIKCQVEGVGC